MKLFNREKIYRVVELYNVTQRKSVYRLERFRKWLWWTWWETVETDATGHAWRTWVWRYKCPAYDSQGFMLFDGRKR